MDVSWTWGGIAFREHCFQSALLPNALQCNKDLEVGITPKKTFNFFMVNLLNAFALFSLETTGQRKAAIRGVPLYISQWKVTVNKWWVEHLICFGKLHQEALGILLVTEVCYWVKKDCIYVYFSWLDRWGCVLLRVHLICRCLWYFTK